MGTKLGGVAQFMRLALGGFSCLLVIVLLLCHTASKILQKIKFGTGKYDWSKVQRWYFQARLGSVWKQQVW